MFQIGLRRAFAIKKVENTVSWTYVITDLRRRNCWNFLQKRISKKQIKMSLELKK